MIWGPLAPGGAQLLASTGGGGPAASKTHGFLGVGCILWVLVVLTYALETSTCDTLSS